MQVNSNYAHLLQQIKNLDEEIMATFLCDVDGMPVDWLAGSVPDRSVACPQKPLPPHQDSARHFVRIVGEYIEPMDIHGLCH